MDPDLPPNESVDEFEETANQWLSCSDPGATLRPTPSPLKYTETLEALGLSLPASELVMHEAIIGKGGMATVHRAEQKSLSRGVAVKVQRNDKASATATGMLHEAWLTGSLEHPNVVPVYDLRFNEDGQPLVLMRHIEGTSWDEVLRQPSLVKNEFGASDVVEWHLRVFLQVCNAVDYAHSVGVVHRDIKPENVMIGFHGEVYLLDWGIAMAQSGVLAEKLDKLSPHSVAGTPCYLAPEMLNAAPEDITKQTDIYLLTGTLYHLITGRSPHPGSNIKSVLRSVRNDEVAIPEDLPEDMREVLRCGLARNPKDRFESVQKLRFAVEQLLAHRSSHQLVESASEPVQDLYKGLLTMSLSDPEQRTTLYGLYSDGRAAFRSALYLWDANPAALRGLQDITEAMIDAELADGTPRAVAALLTELAEPSVELLTRVADAQDTEDAEHEAMARMASIAQSMSSHRGAAARVVMLLLVGGLFAVQGFVFLGDLTVAIAADAVSLAGLTIYGGFTWKLWAKRKFTRRTIGILCMVFFVQLVRHGILLVSGASTETIIVQDSLMAMMALSIVTISFDSRLWPIAMSYGIAHLWTLAGLGNPALVVGASHLFLGVYAAAVWWPSKKSPEPREKSPT